MPREDLIIKKDREALSKHQKYSARVTKERESLERQYKQVIDELRRHTEWLKTHAPLVFVIYLVNLIKGKKVNK